MSNTIRDLTTVLKLEVEDAPTGIVNLIPNPDGELGGWGFLTNVGQPGYITGDPVNLHLVYHRPVPSIFTSAFETEPIPFAAGEYAAAYYVQQDAANSYHKVRLQWLDDVGNVVSTEAWSSLIAPSATASNSIAAVQAPAGTEYVKVQFGMYNSGGAENTSAHTFTFTDLTLAAAVDPADLTGMTTVAPPGYIDILGPATDIQIERAAMDLGTMSANVRDVALDPATATLIRPGARVRLRALNDDTANYDVLFSGKAQSAKVTYDLERTDDKQASITLLALDGYTALTNTNELYGMAEVANLPIVIEGAGIPWNCDGNTGQVTFITLPIASNTNVSVAEQIILTRDSVLGYAWVTKEGVINAWTDRTADYYGNGTAVLDESDYTAIDTSYDTEDCINEVMVTLLTYDDLVANETTEATYGPFRDGESRRARGPRQATFVVHGIDPLNIPAYASEILTANATPALRVNGLVVPIREPADITNAKALLDLYAMVNVENTNKGIDLDQRITKISHQISPGKWVMSLGFGGSESVSSPITTSASSNIGGAGGGTEGLPGPPGADGADGADGAPGAPGADGISGFIGFCGDGVDGNAIISTTVTLTTDMFYDDLTVASGGTIKLNGYRIFCKNDCVVDAGGAIEMDGAAAINGAGGVPVLLGGSLANNQAGAAGGASAGVSSAAGSGGGFFGGRGGTGGNGSTGAGANGGAIAVPALGIGGRIPRALPQLATGELSGSVRVQGGTGGGSASGNGTSVGGGGGASGGVVLINAKTVTNNGRISANGGAGATIGTGGTATRGGGGGGGGGVVIINTQSFTGTTPVANGGAGGAGAGTPAGTAGTAGNAGLVLVNVWA